MTVSPLVSTLQDSKYLVSNSLASEAILPKLQMQITEKIPQRKVKEKKINQTNHQISSKICGEKKHVFAVGTVQKLCYAIFLKIKIS